MSDSTEPAAVPVLVGELAGLLAGRAGPGAVWRLTGDRQLDANLVRLPAGDTVALHVEPDLDVLLLVADGSGRLDWPTGSTALTPGVLVWLPRGAARSVTAGGAGLGYLTVHRRRPGLQIRPSR